MIVNSLVVGEGERRVRFVRKVWFGFRFFFKLIVKEIFRIGMKMRMFGMEYILNFDDLFFKEVELKNLVELFF